jgi:1,5-anhydro-D-fructose reductase (1,5-anhydro-D-mannitol-forming)
MLGGAYLKRDSAKLACFGSAGRPNLLPMSIRWGILGCGDVCEVKSGPAFQQAAGSELYAVMRRDRRLAEDFARRHAVPAFYDRAEELIADPRVDAVYIAAPPGSHLELALLVAAAGKPAYVEKPMARTHAECQLLVEAFARAEQPLFVAYYRRALPRFLKAKAIVDSGVLGQISDVEARYESDAQLQLDPRQLPWRVAAEHAGAGLFLDLASHTLDALDFLFGALEDVSGEASNLAAPGDVEDRVALRFRTAAGARGSGDWNFSSPSHEDTILIRGNLGSLRLATFGDGPLELEGPSGRESFVLQNPVHIQQPFIQTVVDALLGRGSCASTGVSAARTSYVMDRALESYYGSRGDGFWRHPERWPGRRSR